MLFSCPQILSWYSYSINCVYTLISKIKVIHGEPVEPYANTQMSVRTAKSYCFECWPTFRQAPADAKAMARRQGGINKLVKQGWHETKFSLIP